MAFKKEVIFSIDSSDFNDFLIGKYGGDFEFMAQEEGDNGASYDYNVDGGYDLEEQEADEIRNGDYGDYFVSDILDVLCADGHIEAGKYLISINY